MEGISDDTLFPKRNHHLKNTTRLDQLELEFNMRLMTAIDVEHITVAILCFINLVNFMDRYTLAGVLGDIKKDFAVGDDEIGFLELAFVVSLMMFTPVFGYLGDRYSRRKLMAYGITFWCFMTLLGSVQSSFIMFTVLRSLVGVGEAAFLTVAPTIISDMFVGIERAKMFAIFHFTIPVGGGLGDVVGQLAETWGGHWRWALRVTPILGAVGVVLVAVAITDPERGVSEGSHLQSSSYLQDIQSLFKNPTYLLTTFAFSCVVFTESALSWWGPQIIHRGFALQNSPADLLRKVSLFYGLTAIFAGLLGMILGAYMGAELTDRYPRSHPVICGTAVTVSAGALLITLDLCEHSIRGPFIAMFICQALYNISWPIIAEVTMYVVIPPRRSTAEGLKIFISHLLGDAPSSLIVGVLSESFQEPLGTGNGTQSRYVKFSSLQYAMLLPWLMEVIGGVFYFLAIIYIIEDKEKVDIAVHGGQSEGKGKF